MKWFDSPARSEANRWVRQLSDPEKRKRAAGELLRLGGEAAPTLIEALRSTAPDLPAMAEVLLVQIGPAATPALTACLRDDDPQLRGQCAHILARTKDPLGGPALVEALQDRYFSVREKATRALGEIRDTQTLPSLTRVLSDPEPEVRSSALLAIGQFCDPTTFDRMADLLLEDPHLEVRQAAAKALGDTRHAGVLPYLIAALRDSFWWYEREAAITPLLDAFVHIGPPAVAPLIQALQDAEGTVRRFAAILLGRIGDERAIEPLGIALYDMHYEVGHAAAESLAGFGEAGLKILVEALGHPEAWLRQHAVSGLTLSGDQRITPVLVNLLDDPEREVVKLVIRSLGEMGDGRALVPLQKIAADRSDRELSSLARGAIEVIKGEC